MPRTTVAEYNVYRHNDADTVAHDVNLLCNKSTAFTLNEIQFKHMRKVKRTLKKRGYRYDRKRANMIVWRDSTYERVGRKRTYRLCKKADIALHPARWLLSRDLQHRDTGTLFTVHCAHLPQGYAKDPGAKPERIHDAEVAQGREAVANLDRFLTDEIMTRPASYHWLGGDLNARIANHARNWYPGVALADQWDLKNAPQNSIIWLVLSRKAGRRGLRIIKRTVGTKAGGFHSDHPAHLAYLEW